jgi:hypothetical protein
MKGASAGRTIRPTLVEQSTPTFTKSYEAARRQDCQSG